MTTARDILAGEVAASGKRSAIHVADGMLKRPERAGFAIVHVSQARAVEVLLGLDAILDLRAEEAEIQVSARDIGIEDLYGLMAACTAVREVLDGPETAAFVASYYRLAPAA